MKFEDVFLNEKQTILGPDRDVGSIPITRSILFHSADLQQRFVHNQVMPIAPGELLFPTDNRG